MISLGNALMLAGLALIVAVVLIKWQNVEESCDGTVVRNAWDWPTCIEEDK